MAAAKLDVDGVTAGYGSTEIVSGISFSVSAGERLAIFGRNGVGKTTLLATLMGLTSLHRGRILLNGADLAGCRTSLRAERGLGYVPQTRGIFGSLTVEENLLTGLKGRPRADIAEAYAMFPRLAERRSSPGLRLSGGEQQMLSLARTLLGAPPILLLDEPLEGIAPIVCDEIMERLTELAVSREIAIVLVEQQIERAMAFAERAIAMERGRIVWSGASVDLRRDADLIDRVLGMGPRL